MNHKLTCLIIIAVAVMLLSQSAYALERRSKSCEQDAKQQLNRWSFGVAFDANLEDDNIHGIRFSLMHQADEHSALRLNFGIVGHDRFNNGIHFNPGGYIIDIDDDPDFDVTGVNISLQYLFYPMPHGKLNPYFGIGPRFSVDEARDDIIVTYYYDFPNDYEDFYNNDLTRLAVGLETTFGLEWSLGSHFSLITEIDFVLQNEWYAFEIDYYDHYGHRETEVETFNDGVHFDASRLKLGMAFHF